MWGLLPIESTYFIACLVVNTDAVRGRTNAMRGGSPPAAQPRSLEGTLVGGSTVWDYGITLGT